MSIIAFWVLAVLSVVFAVAMICQRNTVRCAVWLIGVMLALAGLYLLLDAEFIAAAQVILYAGAIMVLFVFVIMLLGAQPVEGENTSGFRLGVSGFGFHFHRIHHIDIVAVPIVSALVGAVVVATTVGHYCVVRGQHDPATVQSAFGGNVQAVASWLLTRYLYPFEVTSVILLIAMLAVVILAKRRD